MNQWDNRKNRWDEEERLRHSGPINVAVVTTATAVMMTGMIMTAVRDGHQDTMNHNLRSKITIIKSAQSPRPQDFMKVKTLV